jgi:IS5 family transposase
MIHELVPEAKAFVNKRAYGGKKLTLRQKERNRNKSRIRARVEHAFGVIKGVFKFTKVRYRGQERHAGVRGLCVGQLVYGARPFAAHSMGVVRPK